MKTIFAILTLLTFFVMPAVLWGVLEPVVSPEPPQVSGPAAPVPEPQPLFYVGLGLLVLGIVLRRRTALAERAAGTAA